MKKITLIASGLLWISCLIALIIALTNIFPDNPFKEYRLVLGLGFIAVTGLIRKIYQQFFISKNTFIYHIAVKEDFIKLIRNGNYKPENFDSDGFIHCTGEPDTTLLVLGDYFQQVTKEIVILKITINKLTSPVKFEKPASIAGGGTSHIKKGLLFPHIYGALNIDAIIGAAIVEKNNGIFIWPDKFELLNNLMNIEK